MLLEKQDLQRVYLMQQMLHLLLETWDQEGDCITFNCTKMRSANEVNFTSTMDWETLKIGPESALTPREREADLQKSPTKTFTTSDKNIP